MTAFNESAPRPRTGPVHDGVQTALDAFRQLVTLPTVTRAAFVPSESGDTKSQNLVIETSIRSLASLSKRAATQTLTLSDQLDDVLAQSPQTYISDQVKHTSWSEDGSMQAVFRTAPPKNGGDHKKIVEIWHVEDGRMLFELDVSAEHGDWYFDSTFGSVTWHPSSHALVYVAEAPKSKAPKGSTDPVPQADSFKYVPDYGETFTGKRSPCLFMLLLPDSPFASRLDGHDPLKPTVCRLTDPETFESIDFGQPAFLPDGAGGQPRLLATGYSRLGDGRKLGIVYCTNRLTAIHLLCPCPEQDADDAQKTTWKVTHTTALTDSSRSARSPRVLPSSATEGGPGSTIAVFISNPSGGPHASCTTFHTMQESSDGKPTTSAIVDAVSKPAKLADFPGLYVDQLPAKCFLVQDGPTCVVMSSIWRSRRVPVVVDLATGHVSSLAPWPEPNENDVVLPYLSSGSQALDSIAVIGTNGKDGVVALLSSCTSLPAVVVGRIQGKEQVDWRQVKTFKAGEQVSQALNNLNYTVLPLPKFGASEIVLVSPIKVDPAAETRVNLPPLLTIPHGGPHSTLTTDWSTQTAVYALAGYRVALVNYPGSLGFGQDFVDELPPKLGELEVDATLAAGHYLNTLSLASRTRGKKFIAGGSHGGFITAHLTARYPDEYDAALMRNPVTDMMSELNQTDIPDWVVAETNLAYPFSHPPIVVSPERYKQLHAVSPLSFVDQVRTPTMLMLGLADRRVPWDQGRIWYHALKGNGVDAEMMTFPDNGHPLDGTVECEIVNFEAGLEFLARYTEF